MHLPSGAGPTRGAHGRATPVALRLLPAVHHPPARVLVPGAGALADAQALDARGYRVTLVDRSPPSAAGVHTLAAALTDLDAADPWDLLWEAGSFAEVPPSDRPAWAAAVARLVRPGGKLFGAFWAGDDTPRPAPPWGVSPSELLALLSGAFEAERLQAGPPGSATIEAIFVRR